MRKKGGISLATGEYHWPRMDTDLHGLKTRYLSACICVYPWLVCVFPQPASDLHSRSPAEWDKTSRMERRG
jgi:hypothetical protein